MTAPTAVVRQAVATRDQHRCVLCAAMDGLQFNHRRAVGMGGSKMAPPAVDGNLLCAVHNELIEADAHWMTLALAYGVKVRKWADPGHVPMFYPHEMEWYRLDGVYRVKITAVVAHELMHSVYGAQWSQWFQEAKS